MVSRRRPINQRAGAAFCLDGQSKVHLGDVPANKIGMCRRFLHQGGANPWFRWSRALVHDLASRILNSRPVESITQPILEASASRAALAQLVEHRIRNAGVRCSSHLSGTIFSTCSTVSGIRLCALRAPYRYAPWTAMLWRCCRLGNCSLAHAVLPFLISAEPSDPLSSAIASAMYSLRSPTSS